MESQSQLEVDPDNLNEDVARMRTLWVNELNAPEILHYDDEMVTEMLEQIKNQQEYVDTVNEERGQLTEEKAFVNKLYQMEIERLRYMVASYLRTRLRKIEKFAVHILNDPVLSQKLSVKERNYARQFVMIYEEHVNDLAMGKFPDDHRSINAEGMVTKPNLDSFVFCESTQDIPNVMNDAKGVEFITIHAKERYVLRYQAIQSHVEAGEITLI